ncbi:MAG: HD domain-containing protein [Acidobacteriota bacterium]|nr:HD domain-containing protein [Acidobacteriota bacterium]
MKKTFVSELKPGQAFNSPFLVQSKERKIGRTGSAYFDLELRDASGSIRGKVWDCDRLSVLFEPDDIVQAAGSVETFQGSPQVNVKEVRRLADAEVNLLDYMPRTRLDPDEMYSALLARVRSLPDGPLRSLLEAVLEEPAIAEKYKLAPAATVMHHAFLGGLLEHVTSLLHLADLICDHYPWLDRPLVLAGVILHDIGKTEELHYKRSFRYSTRGQLLGHIVIGLEIVRDKMLAIPDFPPELKERIEHIILSHHGQLEFGSPKEPMFPEALVVHSLDELDSKLESMRAQYEAEKGQDGDWTNKNLALGRRLLKPTNH